MFVHLRFKGCAEEGEEQEDDDEEEVFVTSYPLDLRCPAILLFSRLSYVFPVHACIHIVSQCYGSE